MNRVAAVLASLLFLLPFLACERTVPDTKENRQAEAERYLKAVPPEDVLNDLVQDMAKMVPDSRKAEFQALAKKEVDVDKVREVMREALVQHFFAGELKALADSHGSPDSQSLMQKFEAYKGDIIPKLKKEIMQAYLKAPRT